MIIKKNHYVLKLEYSSNKIFSHMLNKLFVINYRNLFEFFTKEATNGTRLLTTIMYNFCIPVESTKDFKA